MEGGVEGPRQHVQLVIVDAQAEHGLGDDPQSEGHHLPADLERTAGRAGGLPAGETLLHHLGHEGDERGDPAVGEGRLHEASLMPPALSLVEHQTAAEEELGALEERALPVVLLIVHQHTVDVVGKGDEVDRGEPQAQADEAVELQHGLGAEPRRVADHVGKDPNQRIPARTRREFLHPGLEKLPCTSVATLHPLTDGRQNRTVSLQK